jgi:hypothetical protein
MATRPFAVACDMSGACLPHRLLVFLTLNDESSFKNGEEGVMRAGQNITLSVTLAAILGAVFVSSAAAAQTQTATEDGKSAIIQWSTILTRLAFSRPI